jgi:hypothetical protein
MDPLNKQERTEAFVKVLALFLTAVILIAIPMYYAFSLPCKVSEEFEKGQKKLKEMKLNEGQFLIKTELAKDIYNQFEQENIKVFRDKLQGRYSAVSIDMENLSKTIPEDTLKTRLYNNVVFSFDKLFTKQEKIFSLRDSIKAILNPTPEQNSGPEPNPETLETKFRSVVKEALQKYDNNRRLAGQAVGVKEKTFSLIVKDLQ